MAKLTSAARVVRSYLARKPSGDQLHSVEAGQELPRGWRINKAGHVITGMVGTKTVEIFSHSDRAIVDFANTSNTPEDIRYFTRKYGVLHRDDLDWIEVAPGERVVMSDFFMIHCGQWLKTQGVFRREWERERKTDDGLAEKLAKHIAPGLRPGRVVKAFVRPSGKTFELALQPDDLEGALWLAFVGLFDRTRKCQNPTCTSPYFLASRKDQKFCNEKCSRLVANRRWWDEHGAEWRKDHKAARKPKGEK
jgi:hypothetical protein